MKKSINPFVFFDWVYFNIAYLHATELFGHKEQKEFIGVAYLSMLEQFNVLSLFKLFNLSILDFLRPPIPIHLYVGLFLVFFILNFIRYKKFMVYDKLLIKYEAQSKTVSLTIRIIVILYVITTFSLSIYAAFLP